jgi:hypothetical protein
MTPGNLRSEFGRPHHVEFLSGRQIPKWRREPTTARGEDSADFKGGNL